jgi:hypothetical protein
MQMGNQELGERLMGLDGEATRVVPIAHPRVASSPPTKPKPTWDALEEEEAGRPAAETDSPWARSVEAELEVKRTKKELALAQVREAGLGSGGAARAAECKETTTGPMHCGSREHSGRPISSVGRMCHRDYVV